MREIGPRLTIASMYEIIMPGPASIIITLILVAFLQKADSKSGLAVVLTSVTVTAVD